MTGTWLIKRGALAGVMLTLVLSASAWAVRVEPARPTPAVTPAATATGSLPLSVVYRPVSRNPKIGDPFIIQVVMTLKPGVTLAPVAYQGRLGDWEVLKVSTGTVRCEGEVCHRVDELTLRTYLSGSVKLPAMPFGFEQGGQKGEFRPLPLTIKVDGLPPKKGDQPGKLRGLKPVQGMISWWLAGWVTLGVAVALAGLWWWLKRRGLIPTFSAGPPPLPPEEMARQRLRQLQQSSLAGQRQDKLYYSQLTDILRRYLEGRYHINAVDRTTHELSRVLKQTTCPRSETVKVMDLLTFSDLVKFAKAGAEEKELHDHWQMVWDFVQTTTPVPVEEPQTRMKPTT